MVKTDAAPYASSLELGSQGGRVATCRIDKSFGNAHDRNTHTVLAQKIAGIMGLKFEGEYNPARFNSGQTYLLPSDTLQSIEIARTLGVRSNADLFGGVVPYAFAATKVITHPLVSMDAQAPAGWSGSFGDQVRDVVHHGFSVFTIEDGCRAGLRLLERGPVRIKPVRATAGRGQIVVHDATTLLTKLAVLDKAEVCCDGLVIEEDLSDVKTCSVGQVFVAGITASYYGIQRLTTDNAGGTVYGGSTLSVVRGGWDALMQSGLPDQALLAVSQARTYDEAAARSFPGLIVSRRNYDVAQGLDSTGRWRSGVLEQSWRAGGASGAEVAAVEAFWSNPELQLVHASTFELYGGTTIPAHATTYFHGYDDRVGFLTKYALIDSYGHPR